MNDLPPIRTPTSALWREFRVRFGPIAFFVVLVGTSVLLWSRLASNPTLAGVGEGVRSLVSAPYAVLVQELKVEPYQMVNQGDVIAVVQPVDPRAQLDLLASEVQLLRMKSQPSLAEENAMNYERIRVELLKTKSELAMAKVNLDLAENDVRRNTPLFKEKLVSEGIYDLSVKTRDMYKAEVEEKTKAVTEIESRMASLQTLGEPVARATAGPSEKVARLEQMQTAAATNWAPIKLVAPISGMVSVVYRQAGEHAVEGDPLVIVSSLWSQRVIGYLRQPYFVEPKVGMKVLVSLRNRQRQQVWTEISKVGAQIETITNSLAFLRTGALVDEGLPIVVNLPPEAHVRPGEVVDMTLRPDPVERAATTPTSLKGPALAGARPLLESTR